MNLPLAVCERHAAKGATLEPPSDPEDFPPLPDGITAVGRCPDCKGPVVKRRFNRRNLYECWRSASGVTGMDAHGLDIPKCEVLPL